MDPVTQLLFAVIVSALLTTLVVRRERSRCRRDWREFRERMQRHFD